METAISSLILFTAFLFAVLTFSYNNLVTQDVLSVSEQEMEVRRLDQAHTDLAVLNAQPTGTGEAVEMTVRNTGDVMLADYDRWDVIVETYYHPDSEPDPDARALAVNWLSYAPDGAPSGPNVNQWSVSGIYASATSFTPEAFDLGIFNPGEEMIVQIMVSPSVALTTTNRATIGIANGIHVSTYFTR